MSRYGLYQLLNNELQTYILDDNKLFGKTFNTTVFVLRAYLSVMLDVLLFSSEPKPCLASPCLNGGSCVNRIGTSCFGGMPCSNHGYECTCPVDFRGPNCERKYKLDRRL